MREPEIGELRKQIKELGKSMSSLQRSRLRSRWALFQSQLRNPKVRTGLIALMVAIPALAYGATLTVPYIFANGEVSDANEVNANFDALANESNAQDVRLVALEANLVSIQSQVGSHTTDLTGIQTEVTDLQTNLDGLETTFSGVTRTGSDLLFSGMNVQIINGSGTNFSTGAGNLIIGYNTDFSESVRTGSHNLVLGSENSYSGNGNIVSGQRNSALAWHAALIGGRFNTASGMESVLIGGRDNSEGKRGGTQIGISNLHRMIDVTDPPGECEACVGAVGDGVTDNSIAVNEAAVYACDNGYKGIYFPEGNFRIGGTINGMYTGLALEASTCPNGISIVGAGADQTTLLPGSTSGQYLIATADQFSDGRWGGVLSIDEIPKDRFTVTISDLRIHDDDVAFHSSTGGEESHGILIGQTGGQAIIERIVIDTVGDEGIDISTLGGRVVVRDSTFVGIPEVPLSIYKCASTLIDNVSAHIESTSFLNQAFGVHVDPADIQWTAENITVRNSSFTGDWAIGVLIQSNVTGRVGTNVAHVLIENNEIETNPASNRCIAGSQKCAGVMVKSGTSGQWVRDVTISNNIVQGAIEAGGDFIERVRVLNNKISPAPNLPNRWGISISGLGSEVSGNHVSGFTRGCVLYAGSPLNGGANSTLQMRISNNWLSCMSGHSGLEDSMIGLVGPLMAPPNNDTQGYFEIADNHIFLPENASIRYGFKLDTAMKNVRIVGNEFHRPNSVSTSTPVAIVTRGDPLVVEGNQIEGRWGGIAVTGTSGSTIKGNQIELDNWPGSFGIQLWDSTDSIVTGNVIHGVPASSRSVDTKGTSDRVICTQNISAGAGGVGVGRNLGCGDANSTVGIGCAGSGVGSNSICDGNIVAN